MLTITELNNNTIPRLSAADLLDEEVFRMLYDEEDVFCREKLRFELEDQAVHFGIAKRFKDLLRAYKDMWEKARKQAGNIEQVRGLTGFSGPYPEMNCGSWNATDEGIWKRDQTNPNLPVMQACYHPILPLERLRNLETGEEKLKLAFKRNQEWHEIIVTKSTVASATKIIALADLGVGVNSENAKYLVKYLADVESLNEWAIGIQSSTSKLGWNGADFLPYDKKIIFDGDRRFSQIADSIQEYGDEDTWFDHIRKLRATGRLEVKFMLAASFASVLVSMVGGLPFFTDLWGMTEGGKTVTLMVAASVWANPADNAYIGDYKTTDVALEAKADMLNNLPMILDDTSRTSKKLGENFEGIVYDLCSGKGKSRSNKELGLNRENRWSLSLLTNGERPLTSYVNQGGAINRVLEIECGERVYEDPQTTAELVKKNYGFAGKRFVAVLKEMGKEKVRETFNQIFRSLPTNDKMQKQSMSLSIVLTADKIATDALFGDKEYIPIDEAIKSLTSRSDVSDGQRCYDYIMDKVSMNPKRFEYDSPVETWGLIDDDYVMFLPTALDQLCAECRMDKKSFIEWAVKRDLILKEGSRTTKLKKANGIVRRYVFLKRMSSEEEGEEDDDTVNFE